MNSEILRYWRLTENEVKYYRAFGYLSLPGLIDRDTAAILAEEVLQVMEGLGIKREDLRTARSSKDKLRQSRQYLAKSMMARLIHSVGLNAIAAKLMGGPSTLYLPFTAVKSGGGGGRFHFHQDNQYTRFDGPGINIWFALGEMTPENGCLQVAPLTHRDGTIDSVESEDRDGPSNSRCRAARFSAAAYDARRCRGIYPLDAARIRREQQRSAADGLRHSVSSG